MTFQPFKWDEQFRRIGYALFSAWLIAASSIQIALQRKNASLHDLKAIQDVPAVLAILIGGAAFLLFYILQQFKIKGLVISLSAGLLYTAIMIPRANSPLVIALIPLCLVIIYYIWPSQKREQETLQLQSVPLKRKQVIFIILIASVQVLIFSILMCARIYAFHTPTYDHGIFSQLFYQMTVDGTQVTTLERGYALSHFAVHVSPILYLLLPFYALIPRPETIQVLQILVVASGFIPLRLILKKHGFQAWQQILFAILYFFSPALNGSSLFDFHENCFLAPLLLWLFYALERRHRVGSLIATLLLLAVKEDVVIYLAFIGLWLLFQKRWKSGLTLIILPSIVFALEVYLLNHYGDGSLASSRFPNVSAFPELGLLGIIPTTLLSPAYLLGEIFTEEKWVYIIKMLLPLGFTPLFQKKDPRRLILLCPFIIMNLISSYPYLHDISFQYNYGNAAILLYLSILFWSDVLEEKAWQKTRIHRRSTHHKRARILPYVYNFIIIASLSGSLIFCMELWEKRSHSLKYVLENRAALQVMHEVIDSLPQDAYIRATTFLTTNLSNRSQLYDIRYTDLDIDPDPTDYYLFDRRCRPKEETETLIASLKQRGWTSLHDIQDWILVLEKEPQP